MNSIIKKLCALCVCLCFLIIFSMMSLGAGAENLLVDEADLLTESEENEIETLLTEISERNECAVAILTTDDLDGKTAQEFADDYYDYNGYGYGDTADGLLLVVSMAERDWYITTTGFAIDAVCDYDIDAIGEEFVPYLSRGDYDEAFKVYAKKCDELISYAKLYGTNDDYYSDENAYYDDAYVFDEGADYYYADFDEGFDFFGTLGVCLIIGFALSIVTVTYMKSKLKTVRMSAAASDYVKRGSLNITHSSEHFLYKTVSKTPKPRDDDHMNHNHGGGGFSSTHVGSSGVSHGGGGGKF